MARQHRLQFSLRGAEFACAISKGDLAALEEVAAHCCDVWNGANSLIVVVDDQGHLPPTLDDLLEVRDVERIYVHERIPDIGRDAIATRFGDRMNDLRREAFRHELHPLNLQPTFRDPPEAGPRLAMPIPVYENDALQRVARLAFGRIDSEDRDEYAKAFLLEEHQGDAAHFALIDAQVSRLSPLAQSAYLMEMYQQSGPLRARQLVIVDGNDFDALVLFWNLRARATTHGVTPAVVAVPVEALGTPERLRSLLDWTRGEHDVVKPDLLVIAGDENRDEAANALEEVGYRLAAADARLTEYWGEVPEERRLPEYAFSGNGWIGGRLRRGILTDQLVTLEPGRNLVRLEPKGFATANPGGYIRLDLLRWPLPFRPTARTAVRVHENAFVYEDVVCLLTSATNNPLTFDLVVPGADDALADFLGARGMVGELSAAGRYAQALIGRVGGPQRLEALAQQRALHVLQPLTSPSRLKLVQRLGRMLADHYLDQVPTPDELADMIRGQVIALDLPARSLGDLVSQTGTARAELLTALEPLLDVGFIRRGRTERCPHCGYEDFYSLGEVDERLNCHACQQLFLLQVSAGPDEPSLAYQLDPLMARAMDQDLLPVLLTLRHLYSPEGSAAGAFWPGLEIALTVTPDTPQDCDILFAQDGNVTICECKNWAPSLSVSQAEATLALADRLEARTIFAAMDGEFSDEVRALAEPPHLQLLTRTELVPGGA